MYIGKGNIVNRLREEQRKSWTFNTIEYSTILSSEEAYLWEYHWINSYKSLNNAELPIYNKVSSNSSMFNE